ncbi:hypothetical protein AB0I81_34865 [Nonomuraea sp. NPDC050404]|uniref:hypothetical protein n=1 Tax=Nonomuraea sp. NPDC050404 TaxID=3155783 RepID=UPI0033EC8EF6
MTGTVRVVPPPDDVPLADHLQGVGTVAAVVLALILALVETRRRKSDLGAAKKDREEDHEHAERRLQEEREAGDRRLQLLLEEGRERDRNQLIIEQLQKASLYWAQGQVNQLATVLPVIPDQYATILRYFIRGADPKNQYGFASLSETTLQVLEQRLGAHGLENHGPNYLASIIEMREEEDRQSGRANFRRLEQTAVEMLRVGYEYSKIQQEWLYEEIGVNITELMKPVNSLG